MDFNTKWKIKKIIFQNPKWIKRVKHWNYNITPMELSGKTIRSIPIFVYEENEFFVKRKKKKRDPIP